MKDSYNMKCNRLQFFNSPPENPAVEETSRPELPDFLTDCLTGREMPFSNRDNIRQKALRFLLEEKGYLKEDITVDREIMFELEGRGFLSLVDISIALGGRTVMVWKCASGSLVSRERQIIASARLLEDYVIPFSAVTNGKDLEILDSSSERVLGSGFAAVPSKDGLREELRGFTFRPVNKRKLILEQRILYTYDAFSCSAGCNIGLKRDVV